jgi:hypothetical protein
VLVSETAIPLALPTTHARIFIDKSFGHDTVLALANPSAVAARVSLRSMHIDGHTAVSGNAAWLRLPGYGHRVGFVGALVKNLPEGFKGLLDISAQTPFLASTWRSLVNLRNGFFMTAFPVADFTRRSDRRILFPYVAAGPDCATEILLLNAGPAMNPKIRFLYGFGP